MTTQTLPLATAVLRFAATRRRAIALLCVVRCAWVGLAAAMVLVYVDVLVQLTGVARLALLCASSAGLVLVAAYAYYRYTRAASESRMVARLLEQGEPGLHNDLINALEFEELLARGDDTPLSRPLMGQEIAVAAEKAGHIGRVATLRPPTTRRELQALVVEAFLALLLFVIFRDVFAAVVPRYLDPFGDHPPYSATALALEPAGVTVDYGDKVSLRALTHGPEPDEVTLVLEDVKGTTVAELPMLRAAAGDYRQSIEHAKEDLRYYARIDRGRSKRFPLTITKVPRIGSASVTYRYPEYTRLREKTRQIADAGVVRAYEGTVAELSIASNRPLRAGTLQVNGAQTPFAPAADPQSASGSFPIVSGGTLEARLVDVEGNASKESLRARIEVQPDEKPQIEVTSPGRQAFAIPTAQVPLEIEAQDDLGIAKVVLFRSFNGSRDLAKTVFESAGGELQAHAVEVLDLPDLGVLPGDVIDFYATATDFYPKGPQTSATPAYRLTIISEEQFRTFQQKETTADDLKEQYETFNAQLESLAKAQADLQAATDALKNALAAGAPVSDADRQKLRDLAKQQSALAAQTAQAAKELRAKAGAPDVFDIEKDFKDSLRKMAERLDRAESLMKQGGEQLDNAASGQGDAQQQALADAASRQQQALQELGQGKQEFAEKVAQPMEDLSRMYKLLEDVETFKALYQAQEELERQARTFSDVRNPSLDQQVRLKELSQAQGEIRDGLIDLRNAIDKHAAEIEPALPQVARDARGIIDGIDGSNIPTVMEKAAGSLSAGDGGNGHAGVEEALRLMDQMIDRVKQAEGSSAQSEARLRITMGLDPGNTMSQMRQSMRGGFNPTKSNQNGSSSGGANASESKFDVFGPEGQGKDPKESSVMAKKKAKAQNMDAGEETAIAGSFEEIDVPKARERSLEGAPAEPIAEEYRNLIDAYFERIAEEKP